MPLSPLADDRNVAVREDHWRTGLYHSGAMCSHDIGSEIAYVPGNADRQDQHRDGKAGHYNLQMGCAICGVHRPVHGILQRYNYTW